MNRLLALGLALVSFTCTSQAFKDNVSSKYFHHWESVYSPNSDMEIIIHKDGKSIRVTELRFTHTGAMGQAIIYSTVYVCKNKHNRIIVETVDPSTLQIHDSEYILTRNKQLLRVTNNDTLTFNRRY